jgi:hypothetical protein
MFGADRVPEFSARFICLTLTVESKSQIAAPVTVALLIYVKNGRKKKMNPFLKGYYFLLTSAAI